MDARLPLPSVRGRLFDTSTGKNRECVADDLTAEVAALPDKAVVEVRGALNAATAPQLRDALRPLIEDPNVQLVVVNVQRVTFIDSSGLGTILGALRDLRSKGGDLWLSGPSRATRRLLDLTGLGSVIHTEKLE